MSSWLTVTAVVLATVVLPGLFYLVFYHRLATPPPFLEVARHIALNAAACLFVLTTAARVSDRLDRRLAAVLASAVMAHGSIAFMTLALRIHYSNQLMVTSLLMSVGLGFAILMVRRRYHRVCAALVGSWHPLADRLKVAWDHVDDQASDLRHYDLVLTSSSTPGKEWARSLTQASMAGRPIRHVADYIEEEQGMVSVEHFQLDHLPVGGLTSYQARKRALDILIVILAAPVAIPAFLLGFVLVRATMGGPALFVQERVGLGGEVFRIYKLRTMKKAEANASAVATSQSDNRITPIGAWLRKVRIDELPQFWNVLKGDMSIIGPRPEMTELNQKYVEQIPAYAYRTLVRPGISGWAQVRSGYASDLEETRVKLGYDLFYLKNLSYALDLQIVMRTFGTLLTGFGAR